MAVVPSVDDALPRFPFSLRGEGGGSRMRAAANSASAVLHFRSEHSSLSLLIPLICLSGIFSPLGRRGSKW